MPIPRTLPLLAVAAPLALAAAGAQHARAEADEAAVRETLQHYFRAQMTGDGSHHRLAFQPSANLYWIRDGKFAERTSAEFIAGATGAPPADAAQRRQRIAHVDVAGTAAVAKLVTETPERVITDYMTLLRTESGWRIVSKTFAVEPRRAR